MLIVLVRMKLNLVNVIDTNYKIGTWVYFPNSRVYGIALMNFGKETIFKVIKTVYSEPGTSDADFFLNDGESFWVDTPKHYLLTKGKYNPYISDLVASGALKEDEEFTWGIFGLEIVSEMNVEIFKMRSEIGL